MDLLRRSEAPKLPPAVKPSTGVPPAKQRTQQRKRSPPRGRDDEAKQRPTVLLDLSSRSDKGANSADPASTTFKGDAAPNADEGAAARRRIDLRA